MKKKTKVRKKENTNKGITLIALVITIIVLLILAGISIAILTGENGILNKANKAKQETERGMAKEKVQLAVMASYGNDGKLNYNELKDNLNHVEGITNVPNSIMKESFPLKINVDGYQVTIEENGTVTIEGEKIGTVPTPPQEEKSELEKAKENGKVLDENNPTTIKDKYDNKIVVPEGFKIASDSAEDVTGGVVIEDGSHGETAGSQFVWIPIGEIKGADGVTKTIELNRYTFAEDGTPTKQGDNRINIMDYYCQELATSDKANTVAKDIEVFKTSVAENRGYYIGRYEAGDATATTDRSASSTKITTPVCKQGQYVYSWVTQPEAATLSRDMYRNKKFTSDLINSYAWDTAIMFIQQFSRDEDYSGQTPLQNTLAKTGEATDGTNKDVRCNIYDMAGNIYEWTTETSSNSDLPCVGRGGWSSYSDSYTSFRSGGGPYAASSLDSFRPLLYVNI